MITVKTNGKDYKVFLDNKEIGFILPWDNYGRTWFRGTIVHGLIYSSSFPSLEEAVQWTQKKYLVLNKQAE